jgi:Zn-dependent protease/CBS domain-containing protein
VFGPRLKLFTLAGFSVYADLSWVLIFMLVTWSLSSGFFPATMPELSVGTTWAMGVVGALGLFLSIVIHELAHSLMARRRGTEIKSITLFVFGGVAEMGEEPQKPGDELRIAIVGPLTSIGLAVVFFGLSAALVVSESAPAAVAVLQYLSAINLLLAGFNLIPAFPLDGGRVLRAILWKRRGDLRRATGTTAALGRAFGMGLVIVGVLTILSGNFVGGMWYALIGMFLRGAAQQSYSAVVTRLALEGEPVRRFMQRNVVTVDPAMTLARFVDDILYPTQHKLFPVVADGRVIGTMTTAMLRDVPRDRWERTLVGEAMEPLAPENHLPPGTDAVEAMARMNKTRRSRLVVLDEDLKLAGILTLKDLLAFLELKVELEDDDRRPRGPSVFLRGRPRPARAPG